MSTSERVPRQAAFWLLVVLLGMFLFAASAPSPLYRIYAARWRFSSITLTAIFAAYPAGALVALLLMGRLSDHLGRRPVAVASLAVQIGAMAAFIMAGGVLALYLARTLQGAATGVATGAISAWLLDLQPPELHRFTGVVTGVALIAGLGAGALASSLLVQFAPSPLHLVFWLLAGVFSVALLALFAVPDPAVRTPGAVRSLRPQVGVPRVARRAFAALMPALVATWALAGLYLSLGPSLAVSLLATESRIPGGFLIMALMGAGAVASVVVRNADSRAIVVGGSLLLVAGVAITLAGVALGSAVGLYAGTVVAGLGFGPAFAGVVRTLAQLAPPRERGALLASMYIALYASFSVPTVAAGIAVANFPLRTTTYVYGATVIVLALATALAMRRAAASNVAA